MGDNQTFAVASVSLLTFDDLAVAVSELQLRLEQTETPIRELVEKIINHKVLPDMVVVVNPLNLIAVLSDKVSWVRVSQYIGRNQVVLIHRDSYVTFLPDSFNKITPLIGV